MSKKRAKKAEPRAMIRDRIVELRRVRAGDLKASPKNWRKHPQKQQQALRGILAEVGYADACLARVLPNGDLELIDGHLRAELDPEQIVPVLVLDVDEAEAAKLLAVIDPLAAMAEADTAKLDALLREIDTGSEALQAMLAELAQDAGVVPPDTEPTDAEPQTDRAAELAKAWGTASGQLWEIVGKAGTHRVLCGDSTKAEDVGRLMGDKKCRLIATDPPYGVDFVGAKYCPTAKKWAAIDNDKRQGGDLRQWLACMWRLWLGHAYSDASFYSWTAAMEEGAAAAAAMRDAGIHVQSQIIWVKNALVLGQADYQWKHENCWYGFIKGKKHRWLGGRSQTTVWEISKLANSQYVHPMQKPWELYGRSIENHTGEGDIVADPFLGSGSQLIAAENLGRICYGMEISPAYLAVILQRAKDAGMEPRLAAKRTTGD